MKNYYLAEGYGCDAYGKTANYGTCATTTTSGSSSHSLSSFLANTGMDAALVATIAALLIFVGLLVRFIRKPKKQGKT